MLPPENKTWFDSSARTEGALGLIFRWIVVFWPIFTVVTIPNANFHLGRWPLKVRTVLHNLCKINGIWSRMPHCGLLPIGITVFEGAYWCCERWKNKTWDWYQWGNELSETTGPKSRRDFWQKLETCLDISVYTFTTSRRWYSLHSKSLLALSYHRSSF